MKILLTCLQFSEAGGGVYEVVRQIALHMKKQGHEVHIATTAAAPAMKDLFSIHLFDLSGSIAYGLKGEVEAYENFLVSSDFDVMMNYAVQQPLTDIALLNAHRIKARRIIVPCGYSGLKWRSFQRFYKDLPAYLRHYDLQILHSDTYRDADFARRHGLGPCILIPNGYDDSVLEPVQSDFRRKHDIAADSFMILNVANFTGEKGHFETVLAYMLARGRTQSDLVLIGKDLNGKRKNYERWARLFNKLSKHRKIHVLECERTDIRDAYKAADLFVLLSNIEYSPVVLFEALGSGLPFVSAASGNAAEIVTWTNAGLIAPSHTKRNGLTSIGIPGTARLLASLIRDKNALSALKAGALQARDRFRWSHLCTLYEQAFINLASNDKRS